MFVFVNGGRKAKRLFCYIFICSVIYLSICLYDDDRRLSWANQMSFLLFSIVYTLMTQFVYKAFSIERHYKMPTTLAREIISKKLIDWERHIYQFSLLKFKRKRKKEEEKRFKCFQVNKTNLILQIIYTILNYFDKKNMTGRKMGIAGKFSLYWQSRVYNKAVWCL